MLGRLLRELRYLWYSWQQTRDDPSRRDHYFIDAGYIAIGKNYTKNSEHARSINRRESLADMRELVCAHTLLLGIIAGMLEEYSGRRVPIEDESTSRKFVLTAAFIQGISLCEQSILQSMYLQAGALIRQEYETLGLLSEIRNGTRRDGKQANAKYAPWKGSRHYRELSALAHLSDHRILDSLIGYNTSWGDYASAIPQYQKISAARLFSFHTSMVLGLVEELSDLYEKMYGYKSTQREIEVRDNAFSILVKHGVFKVPARPIKQI